MNTIIVYKYAMKFKSDLKEYCSIPNSPEVFELSLGSFLLLLTLVRREIRLISKFDTLTESETFHISFNF